MISEIRARRERLRTVVLCRLLLVLYGVVLCLALRLFVHEPGIRAAAYATAAVVIGAGFRWPRVRAWVRVVAGAHFAVAVLLFRVILRGFDGPALPGETELSVALLLASLTVPVGAVLLIREPVAPAEPLDLPVGYEVSFGRKRELTTGQRLAMWLGFTVLLGLVLVGGPMLFLFASIVLVPIGIGIYFLWLAVVSRRTTKPTGPRKLRLHPKMRKPAQTRSHWSVGPSPYDDEDVYKP